MTDKHTQMTAKEIRDGLRGNPNGVYIRPHVPGLDFGQRIIAARMKGGRLQVKLLHSGRWFPVGPEDSIYEAGA